MQHRSQSAMEYLMTYGWTILIIAIIIVTIFSLGLFNANGALASTCLPISGYQCSNLTITASGTLRTTIGQIGLKQITIVESACSSNATTPAMSPLSQPVSLYSGQTGAVTSSCFSGTQAVGKKYSGYLWIGYTVSGSSSPTVVRVAAITAPVSNPSTQGNPSTFTIMIFNTSETTFLGPPANTLVLPISGSYQVNWGDGTGLTSNTATHVYATPGVYTVDIINNGGMTGFSFNNGAERFKLITISQWGNIVLGNGGGYFNGCSNMNVTATDSPSLTGTTNLYQMFENDYAFNGNIGNWNTANVTNMEQMFEGDSLFNQNIGSWNTRNVTDMGWMFFEDAAFNQNIGSWNTLKVTTMSNMFSGDYAFNQNIGSWNTNSVTDMSFMFEGDTAFNQNIGAWNTNSVTEMSAMFEGATAFNQNLGAWNTNSVTDTSFMFEQDTAFNQNIGSWNTGSVTTMNAMFYQDTNFNQNIGAWNTNSVKGMRWMFWSDTAFNQNLGSWNTVKVTTMSNMFNGDTLSTPNYDALLLGWSARTQSSGVPFNGGNSQYSSSGLTGRNILTTTYGWAITDGGWSGS